MIKIFMGEKGTGKTKQLIEMANHSVTQESGSVVFIDRDDRHMYNLNHEIRFVDTSQFEISEFCIFYGFICGIITANFDVSQIYIDSLFKIVDDSIDSLKKFLDDLEYLSKKFSIKFTITISGSVNAAPEYVKQYIA